VASLDFIADTSALVRRLRKDPSVEPFFTDKHFAITFVTLAELSLGVIKARDPDAAWNDVLEALRGVEMFLVSNFTPMIYAGLYRDLESRRTPQSVPPMIKSKCTTLGRVFSKLVWV